MPLPAAAFSVFSPADLYGIDHGLSLKVASSESSDL